MITCIIPSKIIFKFPSKQKKFSRILPQAMLSKCYETPMWSYNRINRATHIIPGTVLKSYDWRVNDFLTNEMAYEELTFINDSSFTSKKSSVGESTFKPYCGGIFDNPYYSSVPAALATGYHFSSSKNMWKYFQMFGMLTNQVNPYALKIRYV